MGGKRGKCDYALRRRDNHRDHYLTFVNYFTLMLSPKVCLQSTARNGSCKCDGGRVQILIQMRRLPVMEQNILKWIISFNFAGLCFLFRDVSAALDAPITNLYPSIPESGTVEAHNYTYYEIQGQDPGLDLTISLTVLLGDPDLYVSTLSSNPYPSRGNSSWSRVMGANNLFIDPNDPKGCRTNRDCRYRVGIYGYVNSSYTITVMSNTSMPTQLVLGQPQTGHTQGGQFAPYALNITSATMNTQDGLQISATPLQGDPDLYISLGADRPTLEIYDFRSSLWGSVQDRIIVKKDNEVYKSKCPGDTCTFHIGVYAYHEADYSLTATVAAEPTKLQQGIPIESTVHANQSQYFELAWPSSADDVMISLSPTIGSPRLYASCNNTLPSPDSHTWSLDPADGRGSGLLRINATDGERQGCLAGKSMMLAVAAERTAAFSLMMATDAALSIPILVSGVQTFGSVRPRELQLYQVRTGSEYSDVDVMLTVRRGEVDLFVSNDFERRPRFDEKEGKVVSYNISSEQDGDDFVHIPHSHFPACQVSHSCYYIIGVWGKADMLDSEFSIVASKVDSTVNLQDGVPLQDTLLPKNYQYYRIPVLDPEIDLRIETTAFGGDPDLYCDVPPNTHPNITSYTWAARGFGADALQIQAQALKAKCANHTVTSAGEEACTVLCGVHGWTNTSYSIMFTANRGWSHPMQLLSGQAQSGSVNESAYAYYAFYISPAAQARSVHISLTPEAGGDQDLYVSCSRDKEPGKEQWDLRSLSWDIQEELVLAPDHPKYCSDCTIYIAVYGYQAGAYTLRATLSDDQTRLQLGVPSHATIAKHSSLYYVVEWQTAADDLSIGITPESGLPHVFASCSIPHPNQTSHDWFLDLRLNQTLRLSGLDAEKAGCALPGKLWLSVYAPLTTCTYNLMASTDTSRMVPLLVAGRPNTGMVRQNELKYFQIRMGSSYVDADVAVTPRTGEVDLYVSNSYEGRPVYQPPGGVVNYTLKSDGWGDDSVHIPHDHYRECGLGSTCYYIVAVFGRGPGRNQFTLTSKLEDSVTTLQDGVAARDTVGASLYAYYKIKVVDPHTDLTVAVTPFSGGDPDLVMSLFSTNHHPTKDNHTLISRSFGTDEITVQASKMAELGCTPNPEQGQGCDWAIGVFGWTNVSYSLLATLNTGWAAPLILFTGQPQSGFITKGAYEYYAYYVEAETESVRFVLTPHAGTDQDLYLSVSLDKEPGKESYDMSATSWAGSDEIGFNPSEAGSIFCTDCTLYLAVHGFEEGSYTLRAETSGMSILQNAVPVTGHVSGGQAAYYKLWNGDREARISIAVTTLSGDADVFVLSEDKNVEGNSGKERALPDIEHAYWRGDKVGDDQIQIQPSDAHFCHDCSYLIAVTGWTNTTYLLTGTVEKLSIVPLAAGRPQSFHVDALELRYFSIVLGNSAQDLRVSLTQLSGRAELLIADSVDMDNLPTPERPNSFRYKSRSGGNPEVVIPGPHSSKTTFAIGVHGFDAADFSILASLSQVPVLIQEGIPIQQSVSAGTTEFFIYRIANAKDISIVLTALQGDPDLLASLTTDRPYCTPAEDAIEGSYTCGNYTYLSQSYASDQIIISHDLPCEAMGDTHVHSSCKASDFGPGKLLTVGVFAFSDATFSLTLTTGGGHAALIAGLPQDSVTRQGIVCAQRSIAGVCDTSTPPWGKAQVAYFALRVAPHQLPIDAHVSITVQPACNTSVTPCQAGCPCSPLSLYVNSCPEAQCSPELMYPSSLPNQHQLSQTINGRSTLFIARDPINPSPGFCDPQITACLYYIAVTHPDADTTPTPFTITASTPTGVTILAARNHPPPPDGILFSNMDAVDTAVSEAKRYQMYTKLASSQLLSLEACSGDVNISVCDSKCSNLYPTPHDYSYFADTSKSCTRAGCQISPSHLPQISLTDIHDTSYFLSISGSGTYYLELQSTEDGAGMAPILAPPPHAPAPLLKDFQADRVTIHWSPASLSVAGQGRSVSPDQVRYTIFAFEEERLSRAQEGQAFLPGHEESDPGGARSAFLTPVLHTVCGVQHYASLTSTLGSKVAHVEAGRTEHTLHGLVPGMQYVFLLLATCDGSCLEHVSRTTPSSTLTLPCNTGVLCQDQHTLYAPAHVSTNPGTGSMSSAFAVTLVLLLLGLSITVITVGLLWRRNQRLEQQLQFELTDTRRLVNGTISLLVCLWITFSMIFCACCV